MAIQARYLVKEEALSKLKEAAEKALNGQLTFHWPLEYPEVFADFSGFRAIVGNPPFIGGTLISGRLGKNYHQFVTSAYTGGTRSGGRADLCCYFFLRAFSLITAPSSYLSLLATNTIAQGDSREVALDNLIANGAVLIRARREPEMARTGIPRNHGTLVVPRSVGRRTKY